MVNCGMWFTCYRPTIVLVMSSYVFMIVLYGFYTILYISLFRGYLIALLYYVCVILVNY